MKFIDRDVFTECFEDLTGRSIKSLKSVRAEGGVMTVEFWPDHEDKSVLVTERVAVRPRKVPDDD